MSVQIWMISLLLQCLTINVIIYIISSMLLTCYYALQQGIMCIKDGQKHCKSNVFCPDIQVRCDVHINSVLNALS